MVTVIDYTLRRNQEGKDFYALILQSDGLSLVKSKNTGNYYATVQKWSISSTFDENTAKMMVGQKVAGSVQKKSCEKYSFVVKDTGEIIELDYRYVYVPEGESLENAIFEGEPQVEMMSQKPKQEPIFLR